ATLLWFPYVVDSYAAIGHSGLPIATLLMGLLMLPLLPALAELGRGTKWLAGVALVATLVFGTLAVSRPAFDADVPRPVNLAYVSAGNEARVFVGQNAAPSSFLHETGFASTTSKVVPWA